MRLKHLRHETLYHNITLNHFHIEIKEVEEVVVAVEEVMTGLKKVEEYHNDVFWKSLTVMEKS